MSAVMIFHKIGVRFGMREMTVEREQYSSITTVCDFAAMTKQISGPRCRLVIPAGPLHTLSTG